MIVPPATAAPPRLGPLPAPSEDELAAAYRELRDQALTLAWFAERLAIEPARLQALARAGELLVVPGPWPMRQAHASGLGFFVPTWQLAPGGRAPTEVLPALLEAAAGRGWTSLDLHRFMTRPLGEGDITPAELLKADLTERVLALAHGEPEPQPPSPPPPRAAAARAPEVVRPGAAGVTGTLTPGRARLPFRDALRRTQGFEAIFWPDGSRGRVEAVTVAPYEFWAESLVVIRDGARLRLPAEGIRQIDPDHRLLLASLGTSSAGTEPARRAAAFFDLDRSLLTGSSALALARALRRRGQLRHRQLLRALLGRLALATPGGAERAAQRLVAEELAAVRGLRPEELAAQLAATLEPALRPRLDRQPLEFAAGHRARGEPVYLVSASLQELVRPLANGLGLDGALGTTAQLDAAGAYTGRPSLTLLGTAKVEVVRELAAREGLDLAASTAYADSNAGLVLLEAVGHPVAVNPDRGLRRVALARGWPLLELCPP